MLAAHAGDSAEGAGPVAALTDLQVRKVPRCDAQPGRVLQGPNRGRAEETSLFVLLLNSAVNNLRDFLAAENADDLINVRHLFEEQVLLPLGKAARDDDGTDTALFF